MIQLTINFTKIHIENNATSQAHYMISFAQNLLKNSKNIESEFVDIVNDNFWDLI